MWLTARCCGLSPACGNLAAPRVSGAVRVNAALRLRLRQDLRLRDGSPVDACHVYYGGGMPDGTALATVRVPVMGSYGALDTGIPKERVDALRDAYARVRITEHGFGSFIAGSSRTADI